jgi:omega-6 fatty acid desaturase (delta-12 desaturase)
MSAEQSPAHQPWREVTAAYQSSDLRRSMWQVANSFIPYFVLWYAMYRSLEISYFLTLALAIPTAGFLVRIFIIFHDCGHGSFFKSQKANTIVGIIGGFLAFVPYHQWRHDHALHHATGSDLDQRGIGDVWMLTVEEYLALSRWHRIKYRFFRNPFVMFGIGPLFMFFISHRTVSPSSGKKERRGVYWTNAALVALVVAMSLLIGFWRYVVVMLPVLSLAGTFGVWLFYVQHQFEDSYWVRHKEWSFELAALEGSSFYKLPKILQWFSGNIGFHHIHHLSPRIPNYFLNKCQNETPLFQEVKAITLFQSLKALTYRLWDEKHRALVGFRHLKKMGQTT